MPARTHHAEFFTYEPDYFLDRRRQQLRARYGARVLAVIERMLVEHLPMRRAVESLGKALQSISGQWRKLEFMKSSLIEAPRERLAPTP